METSMENQTMLKDPKKKASIQEVEKIIELAVQKTDGTKENDICHYLPSPDTAGYMHHFTMRKLKFESPEELSSMIREFVLEPKNPIKITPKQRVRGRKKKDGSVQLNRNAIDRLLNLARAVGDSESIALLTPKMSLTNSKKQLMSSVRNNNVDDELWNAYKESVKAFNEKKGLNISGV
jgi:hypothetical protein